MYENENNKLIDRMIYIFILMIIRNNKIIIVNNNNVYKINETFYKIRLNNRIIKII
jgi:hypothetical protein